MPAALLVLLGAVLLLPELGTAPFERAEIYFMDAARAMVEQGDYVVPYYRGQAFFDKPALTYWLMAASFRTFGFTPDAARLVPALAAMGAVLATIALGMIVLDRRSALTGGLILLTSGAFLSFGRVAMSDMLLALWSTLAVALGTAPFRTDPPPGRLGRTLLLPGLGAVLGLGFLTKGPVAVLLPGLGLGLLLFRGWRSWPRLTTVVTPALSDVAPKDHGLPDAVPPRVPTAVKPRGVVVAAALFLLVGFGWFVLVYRRLGWAPLQYFFLRENIERFAGEAYDAGREPWFYLTTYLAEGLPWSVFLPVALSCYLREDLEGSVGQRGSRFLAAWTLLMLIPLSLSRGKIDYYLLPCYPAASLILGHYFAAVPWGRFERVWARLALLLAALGLGLLASMPSRVPAAWLPGPSARFALIAVAAAGALGCLATLGRVAPARVVAVLAAPTAAIFFVLVTLFLPAFRKAQPNQAILDDVARERAYRPDLALALCQDPARVQRDLLFHTRLNVWQRCALWEPASSKSPFLLLLRPEERTSLVSLPGMRTIRQYRYLPATVLTLNGLLRAPRPAYLLLVANYPTGDPKAETKRRRDRKHALRRAE